MASATAVPAEQPPACVVATPPEEEPLLGRPGGVTQAEDEYLLRNLSSGTAAIAQAGILILVALVWAAVFSNKLIFFSPHPLVNSTGVLLTTEAILLLQPTHTPSQKRRGTLAHASFVLAALVAFVAGLTVVEINKASHPETRFRSPHAVLGLVTYVAVLVQALVGVVQYFVPALVLGSVERGRRVYRWHRLLGYAVLALQLATVAAATQTDYNVAVLHIRLSTVLGAAVLVVAGVGARIKKHKLTFWGST